MKDIRVKRGWKEDQRESRMRERSNGTKMRKERRLNKEGFRDRRHGKERIKESSNED